jgi:cupin 2 domain-containing protein
MRIRPINLFAPLPAGETAVERVIPLLEGKAFRLEQIVSHGQASEPGFWYDQTEDEWVALLRGTATLVFEGEQPLSLTAGDALLIPAHVRHRVAATSPDAVWLALHVPAAR